MKQIPLTRGKFAIVDDEDYDFLMKRKWYVNKSPTKSGDCWYAHHQYIDKSIKNKKGKPKQVLVLMHRLIINAPKGVQVDHINGDGLDNRKLNLRLCDNKQNLWNQKWLATPDKPYKGVTKVKSKNHPGWRVAIQKDGKFVCLGWFKSAEVAAKRYDSLAIMLFGEFACLNFPEK